MHILSVVKMRGISVGYAKRSLEANYLGPYCGDNMPFDYYNDYIEHIDIGHSLLKEWQVDTLQELERAMIKHYKDKLNKKKLELKEYFYKAIVLHHMTFEDAPLYINSDDTEIKALANKVIKGKKKNKPLNDTTSPEALSKAIVSCALTDPHRIEDLIKDYVEIKCLIDYPDDCELSFKSYNAHFIDLSGQSRGKNVYYFRIDRHF